MREIEIHDYARQLLEAHGAQAIAEAAQNAIDLEAKGEVEHSLKALDPRRPIREADVATARLHVRKWRKADV